MIFRSLARKPSIALSMLILNIALTARAETIRAPNQETTLGLTEAVHIATVNDEWLDKSRLEEARLLTLGEGASALPDPSFSVGLLNLPTDGFAFDQEPMTQFKVGASQMFPRGKTLQLSEEKFVRAAAVQPHERADRLEQVTWQTTALWLNAFEYQERLKLVLEAKPLFEKLGDIVNANYSSSLGSAGQQDVIRTDLELIRLNDRLLQLATRKNISLAQLQKYLHSFDSSQFETKRLDSVGELPPLSELAPERSTAEFLLSRDDVQPFTPSLFLNHPRVTAIDQKILAQNVDVDLSKQLYKPQFGINASYAFRDDEPSASGGDSRPEFFSVGMTVSIPVFSRLKQDSQVESSVKTVEATKTERLLVIRELISGLKSGVEQYAGASDRLLIYEEQILPQMTQQSAAALNAYQNDRGDFAEVVRAKIAELDAQVTAINIRVDRYRALAAIRYYTASNSSQQMRNAESQKGDLLHD